MLRFFLNLPNEIKITLISLIIGSLCYGAGNYKGHLDERNSIEVRQKDKTIAQQTKEINMLHFQYDNTLEIVKNLNESNNRLSISNNELNQQYKLKKQELQNADIRNNVNQLNVITGGFLRYITTSTKMPNNSQASITAYGDTTRYTATDVGDAIIDDYHQCEILNNNYQILRNTHIALQAWVKDTINNYNGIINDN